MRPRKNRPSNVAEQCAANTTRNTADHHTPGRSPGLGWRRPDRLALELRVRGLTYQQIALVLNLSTTTAHKAVRRCLARLDRRKRNVLVAGAKINRGLLRQGRTDLRTIVREFYQIRTPRQLRRLDQLLLHAREKNCRTDRTESPDEARNSSAPNNLQLLNKLAKQRLTSSPQNERQDVGMKPLTKKTADPEQAANQPNIRPVTC